MNVVTSLVARISADVSSFNDAMAAATQSTNSTQQAMEQGALAATALQARLTALKQAVNLGAISWDEFHGAVATAKADMAELATQGTLAENTTARLAATSASASRMMRMGMEDVGVGSMVAERGTSRLAFGLALMAQGGARSALSLRSVEYGMMTLLPGLGWGLVAVTALVEGWHLITESQNQAAAAFAKTLSQNRATEGWISEQTKHVTALGAAYVELSRHMEELQQPGLDLTHFGPIDPSGARELTAQRLEAVMDEMRLNRVLEEHSRTLDRQKAAQDKAREAREAATRAAEEHERHIHSIVAALDQEAATHGMTANQVKVYELAHEHASLALVDHAAAVASYLDALNSEAEGTRRTAEVARHAAEERTRAEEEYDRAERRRIEEQIRLRDDAVGKAKKDAEEMQGFVSKLLGDVSRGNIRGVLETIGAEISRRVAAAQELPAEPHVTPAQVAAVAAMTPTALGGAPNLSLRNVMRVLTPVAPEPLPSTATRMAGAPAVGHTLQTAVNFNMQPMDAKSTEDFFTRNSHIIAGVVAQRWASDPNLLAKLGISPQ